VSQQCALVFPARRTDRPSNPQLLYRATPLSVTHANCFSAPCLSLSISSPFLSYSLCRHSETLEILSLQQTEHKLSDYSCTSSSTSMAEPRKDWIIVLFFFFCFLMWKLDALSLRSWLRVLWSKMMFCVNWLVSSATRLHTQSSVTFVSFHTCQFVVTRTKHIRHSFALSPYTENFSCPQIGPLFLVDFIFIHFFWFLQLSLLERIWNLQ